MATEIKASGRTMAMILAAGAGTRARHLTDPGRNKYPMAKPRFPIIETPVMDHWVLALQRMGINHIFANLWSNPATIKSYYASYGKREGIEIRFYEEDRLLGTMGSAVKWAIEGENVSEGDTLFVLSGDIASNADLKIVLEEHQKVGADLTVAFDPVPWSQVKKYGTASFVGLPPKRSKGATESNENYTRYLAEYQREVDEFVRKSAYQALKITDFKEKEGPETCCSNCNNASIYVLSGTFVHALYPQITEVNDSLAQPFYDFGKHGFRFALEKGFNFFGIILPEEAYWMDIGDMGKFWLAIMDTLDGHFDRSIWGLLPSRNERMAFIHPTAYVHPDAELTPPYYIGPCAEIGAGAKVGPYAVVSSYGVMERNARLVGAAMVETAHYHKGDRERRLMGTEIRGAEVRRSLLASGRIYPDQAAQNNVIFIRPDGRQRFAFIGMSRELSEKRVSGERLSAIED